MFSVFMLKGLLFVFFFSFFFLGHGQEQLSTSDFIGPKENIHLHLNKTTFLQGERLWFKAYVRDQNTKLPSLETSNLHVGIYGYNGEEVKRKLLYVENGMAQGDFGIDSTLVDSEYTVLAWTNYMRNFKELEPFRQRITILRDGMEEETGEVDMGISVYPEGGQLIAGAYNNIGILVDNGLGQGVKVDNLELVDQWGKTIRSNIKTNLFGMGKIGFLAEPKKEYFLRRQRPDGSLVRTRIPEAVEGQVGLNIDNNGKNKVLLTFLASIETFSEKDGDIHTIALYQDDFIRFEDMEVNKDEPVLSMDRKELPNGILTAVLFDPELQPIARRMFFNHHDDGKTIQTLDIEHCLSEYGDSLQVDLILPKGVENDINLSISTLPSISMAYDPDHSIASSFLVRPYIANHHQDHYFFEGQDRKKRYELDNRLMLEGWGKYDWDSRKQKELELAFEMETGIPFQGKVIDADLNEENQVSLIAELSAAMAFEALNDNKSFRGNLQLFEGDSLGVSLISKKSRLRRPQAQLEFYNEPSKPVGHNSKRDVKVIKRQKGTDSETNPEEPLSFSERIIALEEVTVVEKVQKTNKTDMFVPRGSLLPITEGRIIGDEEIKRFGSVTAYLNTLGYSRSRGVDSDGFDVDILLSPKSNKRVSVDETLLNLPLSRVQAIYHDVDKKVYVSIILRSSPYERPEDRNKFLKFAIENGYTRPQEYFTPNYPDYVGQVFKNYGALDWKANVSVGADIPNSLNIPIKNQNQIQLYIEGMNANGVLISQSKEIRINSQQL
jgi:hypothetical protein